MYLKSEKGRKKKKSVNQEFYIQQTILQEGKRDKDISDKQKLKRFIISRPALQEMLIRELQAEMKGQTVTQSH